MAILSDITQKTDCGLKPCRRIIEMDMNYAKAKELDPEAIPVVDTVTAMAAISLLHGR